VAFVLLPENDHHSVNPEDAIPRLSLDDFEQSMGTLSHRTNSALPASSEPSRSTSNLLDADSFFSTNSKPGENSVRGWSPQSDTLQILFFLLFILYGIF